VEVMEARMREAEPPSSAKSYDPEQEVEVMEARMREAEASSDAKPYDPEQPVEVTEAEKPEDAVAKEEPQLGGVTLAAILRRGKEAADLQAAGEDAAGERREGGPAMPGGFLGLGLLSRFEGQAMPNSERRDGQGAEPEAAKPEDPSEEAAKPATEYWPFTMRQPSAGKEEKEKKEKDKEKDKDKKKDGRRRSRSKSKRSKSRRRSRSKRSRSRRSRRRRSRDRDRRRSRSRSRDRRVLSVRGRTSSRTRRLGTGRGLIGGRAREPVRPAAAARERERDRERAPKEKEKEKRPPAWEGWAVPSKDGHDYVVLGTGRLKRERQGEGEVREAGKAEAPKPVGLVQGSGGRPPPPAAESHGMPCKSFAARGFCRLGEECPFLHVVEGVKPRAPGAIPGTGSMQPGWRSMMIRPMGRIIPEPAPGEGDDYENVTMEEDPPPSRLPPHMMKIFPVRKDLSEDGAGGSSSSSAPQRPAGWRTVPCRHWSRLGECRLGDGCNFAHTPADPAAAKAAAIAASLGEGRTAGVKARVPGAAPSNSKTQLCRYWEQTGSCGLGARCTYAHGPEELRSGDEAGGQQTQRLTRQGAQDGEPSQEEIDRFLATAEAPRGLAAEAAHLQQRRAAAGLEEQRRRQQELIHQQLFQQEQQHQAQLQRAQIHQSMLMTQQLAQAQAQQEAVLRASGQWSSWQMPSGRPGQVFGVGEQL